MAAGHGRHQAGVVARPFRAASVDGLAFAGNLPYAGNLGNLVMGSLAQAAIHAVRVHFELPYGPSAVGLAFALELAISAPVRFASENEHSRAVVGQQPPHSDAVAHAYGERWLGHHTAIFLEHSGHLGGQVDGGRAYLLEVEEQ